MRALDPRRRGGFTLLEVLCAVAVLGIALAALARASVMGLRDEGETTRRAQASLLADRTIEDVEANMELGQAPELGAREDDEDGLHVKIDVKPFDAQAAGLLSAPAPPADRPTRQAPPGPPQGLLAPTGTGPSPLLWVTVHVSWAEGVYERDVTRATILYDPTAAAALLAPLQSQQGQQGSQGQSGAEGQQGRSGPVNPAASQHTGLGDLSQ